MCGGSLLKKHQTYLIHQNGAGKEMEVGKGFGFLSGQHFNKLVTFVTSSSSVGADQRRAVVEGTANARKPICAARHCVFARGTAETLKITLSMRASFTIDHVCLFG